MRDSVNQVAETFRSVGRGTTAALADVSRSMLASLTVPPESQRTDTDVVEDLLDVGTALVVETRHGVGQGAGAIGSAALGCFRFLESVPMLTATTQGNS